MSIHVFTSFSYSYLDRARVLGHSLRRHHPNWTVWAVITDRPPEGFVLDPAEEPFDRVIDELSLLGQGEASSWLFRHDIVEACTAVKGHALKRILDEPDCDGVIYLDPDIAVFGSLQPVADLLDGGASVVLTPHLLTPQTTPQAVVDNEITPLSFGVYNLGFAGVANDPEGRRFADWWASRLDEWCYDRRDIGIFVDQKWCDLVPCLFENVCILRDPGYNVASWNLAGRTVRIGKDGAITVNGVPLRFYHFTKLGPTGDTMTRRYAGQNVEVYEIWSWYRREVMRHAATGVPRGWWFYGTFEDGTPIPKAARELWRDRPDLRSSFADPRGPEFKAWLSREEPQVLEQAQRK